MEILRHVTISGTVFDGYAYLSQELCYCNSGETGVAPCFAFSLPRGAYLSSLKAVSDAGRVVRAHVVTPADARRVFEDAGRCSVTLERTGRTAYRLCVSSLESRETVRVYVSYYVVTESRRNLSLIYFPGMGVSTCMELEVPGDGVLDAASPSHRIEKTVEPGRLKLRAVTGGSDFGLQIKYQDSRKNHAYILREPFGERIAYYRLYPKLEEYQPVQNREVLFLIDLTASMRGGRMAAAKDVLLAMLKSLSEGQRFNILAAGGTVRPFAPSPVPVDEEAVARVLHWLMEANVENGSMLDGFLELLERMTPQTLPVVITSGETSYQAEILRFSRQKLSGSGMGIVSVGRNRRAEFLDLLAEATQGYILHIFPSSNIAGDTQELVRRLNRSRMEKLEVDPLSGQVAELICPQRGPAESGLDILVKNAGEMPRAFRVHSGRGYSEVISVEEADVFEGFDMIRLIYGESKLESLRQLLSSASPSSWRKIKKQMADVGMQYGILSEEAALAAEISGKRTELSPVRVIIRPERENGDDFKDRASLFQEEGEDRELSGFRAAFRNIRSDGAIAEPFAFDALDRARQTARAALALAERWGRVRPLRPVFADVKDYLLEFKPEREPEIDAALRLLEALGY